MNALTQFQFNTIRLEIVDKSGEPWFIARPLAEYLGYQNPAEAIRTHTDEDEVEKIYIPEKSNNYTCVNEAGLFSLILRSNKPEAKAFKRWVTHDVLPAIRKTGGYSVDTAHLQAENLQLKNELLTLYRENARLLQAPAARIPKRRAWTTEEDDVIHARRAEGFGAARISRLLDRTYDSVAHRIRRLEGKA